MGSIRPAALPATACILTTVYPSGAVPAGCAPVGSLRAFSAGDDDDISASLVIVNCAAHGPACGALTVPMPFQYETVNVRVAEESIGTATMETDGTIVLHLFARGP